MSTPLVVLAAILAIFAFVLIPLMMTKDARRKRDPNAPVNKGAKQQKKKR